MITESQAWNLFNTTDSGWAKDYQEVGDTD